jgi:hypothetical protein
VQEFIFRLRCRSRLEFLGFAFASGHPRQTDADEPALSSCYRVTNAVNARLVDRSDNNAIVFPAEWMEQHRKRLAELAKR